MHGDVQALVSSLGSARSGLHACGTVGDGGEIEEDGRIEGHVEGVQWEVMLFSNVFFKFTVLRKCIFTFLWFFKV